MNGPRRQLLVLRHAKAEQFAASDHDRPLSPRGRADAAEVGRWLRSADLLPDHCVVSSAERTRGTWTALAQAAELAVEPTIDRALYSAGTEAALEILHYLPATARRALLVGHNPTMASLVHLLEDGGAPEELFSQVATGYPTSMLTVLDFAGGWTDLGPESARIRQVHLGRAPARGDEGSDD